MRAFWAETKIARWVLLAVPVPLLVLFRRPILIWIYQPAHPFHLTDSVINFVTLYLAVSGILYAVIHEMRLNEHVKELRAIEESLSTQRIGRFPRYLDEIANLLEGASRVTILADCADYGSFFAPEDHYKLHEAICNFSRGHDHVVQILVAGPPAPLTATSSWNADEYLERYRELKKGYWPKYLSVVREDRGFLRWLEDLASQTDGDHRLKLFTEWLQRYQSGVPEELTKVVQTAKSVCQGTQRLKRDTDSAAAFYVLLQARQYWFEKRLGADRVDIRHIPQHAPLFLWISHKTNEATHREDGIALFAFPDRSDLKGSLAFRTIDSDLIRIFEDIFEELWPLRTDDE